MVTGASGGVGTALVQLARRREAHVVAITSAEKAPAVSGLGADIVLHREMSDLPDRVRDATDGIDVLADVVGGDRLQPLIETIKPGGHYVVSGAVAGSRVELDLRTLYLRDLTFHGTTVVPEDVFESLVGYVRGGSLQPVVDRVYRLDQLGSAQEYFLNKKHVGSVVIDVGGLSES
jgi:NADPH:quinone reductase-like Zn-dependent oxidoreductase